MSCINRGGKGYCLLAGLDHNSDQVGHAAGSPMRHVGCGLEGQAADQSRRAAYWPRAVNGLVAAERLVLTEP